MEFRKLGGTGLDVGIIGLGTEYLNEKPRKTVVSVVREAIDRGVNYFDLVFAFPEYRDNLGAALKGRRDKAILAGHIGPAETNGRYRLTRDIKECEGLFLDLLSRLHTDYVDILFIQLVDKEKDYERIMGPGGLMELALRFQREGKARFIGLSGHKIPVALRAVESGRIDVLMFPINLTEDAVPGKKELLNACARQGVGLVAMKPFAGGKLLQRNRSIYIVQYQAGGKGFKKRMPHSITPVQCISYALSQVGVSTTVPGVKNVDELRATLKFLEATDEERDFSPILTHLEPDLKGECVYCNHCLPCPASIDIGRTIRLIETAGCCISDGIRADYNALPAKASECTECGVCMGRCPFGVDVIAKMRRAVELFEANAG